ncbi:MAG: putative methyltransferase [Deltaproteobacteria bacterium]|nr:MAG: putative methyltransferase [Deltaproteobacteria bacterium]
MNIPTSRQRIRSYTQALLQHLACSFVEEWPDAHASMFRESVEQLYLRCDVMLGQIKGNDKSAREGRLAIELYREFSHQLLWLDWSEPLDKHKVLPEWEERLSGRPLGTMEFDQLFCTVDSTFRRAQALLPYLNRSESRVLCLGDDDLVSLALRSMWDGEIHVLDLDTRLLDFLEDQGESIHCHKHDLDNDTIPENLRGKFDIVLYDPPWEKYPAWLFLQWAEACLRPEAHVHCMVSFCPLYLEYDERQLDRVFQDFVKAGFAMDAIHPRFSLYSLGEENNPELTQILQHYTIPMESLLVEHFKTLPYVCSHLYVLRRMHPQGALGWWRKLRNIWKL